MASWNNLFTTLEVNELASFTLHLLNIISGLKRAVCSLATCREARYTGQTLWGYIPVVGVRVNHHHGEDCSVMGKSATPEGWAKSAGYM